MNAFIGFLVYFFALVFFHPSFKFSCIFTSQYWCAFEAAHGRAATPRRSCVPKSEQSQNCAKLLGGKHEDEGMLEHSPSGFLSILAITISIGRLNEGCQLCREPGLFFVDCHRQEIACRLDGGHAAFIHASINAFWLGKAYQVPCFEAKHGLGRFGFGAREAKLVRPYRLPVALPHRFDKQRLMARVERDGSAGITDTSSVNPMRLGVIQAAAVELGLCARAGLDGQASLQQGNKQLVTGGIDGGGIGQRLFKLRHYTLQHVGLVFKEHGNIFLAFAGIARLASQRQVADVVRAAIGAGFDMLDLQRHMLNATIGALPAPFFKQELAAGISGKSPLLVFNASNVGVVHLLHVELDALDGNFSNARPTAETVDPSQRGVNTVLQRWRQPVFGTDSVVEPCDTVTGLAPAPAPTQRTAGIQGGFNRLAAMGQLGGKDDTAIRINERHARCLATWVYFDADRFNDGIGHGNFQNNGKRHGAPDSGFPVPKQCPRTCRAARRERFFVLVNDKDGINSHKNFSWAFARKIYLARNTKVVQSHAYGIPDTRSYISTSEPTAGEARLGESLSLHFVSSPDTVGGLVELLPKTALIKNDWQDSTGRTVEVSQAGRSTIGVATSYFRNIKTQDSSHHVFF